MFTSDTEKRRGEVFRTAYKYLAISLCCVFFGAVYEHFSHAVYSGYMIYAFMFPLVMGAFGLFTLSMRCRAMPAGLPLGLYNAGVAALTVGSIFEGVLEIYGTQNPLTAVYWIAGGALAAGGLLLYLIGCVSARARRS